MNNKIREELEKLKAQNIYRNLYKIDDGYLNFSSNDYLGLSENKESIHAGYEAAWKYGSGSTGSRLLSGNKQIFEDFEKQIAADKKHEDCLIFNSGFIANFSIISALSLLSPLFIFDKLNHASMYMGLPSDANLKRYKHLDYEELEDILKNSNSDVKVIASETVFGMDGDIADLEKLIELSEKYDAYLVLDEAHATGVFGKRGYGLSEDYEFDKDRTIIMGTFSKALASTGAYVACSKMFKEYLIQKSKGFIYSTAISPFCIGVAKYNWQLLPQLDILRRDILNLARYFREQLKTLGLNCKGQSNIVPIIFPDQESMLAFNEYLHSTGVSVSAIRRPTSPTPRLRFAISFAHSMYHINALLTSFKKFFP